MEQTTLKNSVTPEVYEYGHIKLSWTYVKIKRHDFMKVKNIINIQRLWSGRLFTAGKRSIEYITVVTNFIEITTHFTKFLVENFV